MSKSDRIDVSREVLETMTAALAEVRRHIEHVFDGEPFEQGQTQQCALTRLMDLEIAVDTLCARLS